MGGAERMVRPASRITLDWMLAVVIVIAIALAIGAWVRTSGDGAVPGVGPSGGGLRALAPHERLIVFEDYSYDTQGWDAAEVARPNAFQGSVLTPLDPVAGLTRAFAVPDATQRIVAMFDAIAIGDDTAPDLTFFVNEAEAIDGQGVRVFTEDRGQGRQRIWLIAEPRDGQVTLTLAGEEGAAWAIDNLTLIAQGQPGDAR